MNYDTPLLTFCVTPTVSSAVSVSLAVQVAMFALAVVTLAVGPLHNARSADT